MVSNQILQQSNGKIKPRTLEEELSQAEVKAWESLRKYKFMMFGYWAGVWVHLNRVGNFKKANPFKRLVDMAKES